MKINFEITNQWITEHWNHINWHELSKSPYFSEELIDKYLYFVDWQEVSCRTDLSEQFLDKWKDRIDWENYLTYNSPELSSEFIFSHNINWNLISYHASRLSETFIREYKDYINWDAVSSQILIVTKFSLDFVREFSELLNWEYMCSLESSVKDKFDIIAKEFYSEED